MKRFLPVTDIYAREILDSRGNPTVEVEVVSGENCHGTAQVPSGASTGSFEAVELRDGERRYHGLGVNKAIANVNDKIARELIDMNVFEQKEIDNMLCKLDNSENKKVLGANATLGVSIATARSAASVIRQPFYRYLGGMEGRVLPVPLMNVINGGKHARNALDFQEFMIVPVGAKTFREALQKGTEVYHTLKYMLEKDGNITTVGEEGGFAPQWNRAEEVFAYLIKAVKGTGLEPGRDIVFALDVAANELYHAETGCYYLAAEDKMMSAKSMMEYYETLCGTYPLVSIEDGLWEEDWDGWQKLTDKLGKKIQVVGDDLFVTNKKRVEKGIREGCGNAVLIKPNQIGTLSETVETIKTAKEAGYRTILSHRSGDTEDSAIADLAVAFGCGQVKAGAPCRSERTAKYNRLLKIEEELGEAAEYAGNR